MTYSDTITLTNTLPPLTVNYTTVNYSREDNSTIDELDKFTETNVHFYYAFIALVLCVPALCFLGLYFKMEKQNSARKPENRSESMALRNCTGPLAAAVALMFMQCLLYFGIQDTYSNLLTTFAVLGPLEFTKAQGVYLTSIFWGSMCFGRLNGESISYVCFQNLVFTKCQQFTNETDFLSWLCSL